jgi:Protein of unknown function DUF104/Protein of unknown function (DUF1778)
MTTHVDAVFENGVFRPLQPVQLPEHLRVTVSFATEATDANAQPETVHFVLPPDRWQAFCDALDAPPRDIPALRRLLQGATLFDGNGPAAH